MTAPKDPYASEAESAAVVVPDTRTPAEKRLQQLIEAESVPELCGAEAQKPDKHLQLALEALAPLEKLFTQAEEQGLLTGANVDCQIATDELRKSAYAASDIRRYLDTTQPAAQPAPVQEPDAYRSRLASGSYAYCKTPQFFDKAEPLYTAPPAAQPAPLPTLVTEEMHVAAVKVLQRANGLDGLPQRMLDAMLAAQPAAQPTMPYGWVRMNPGFNSGVFHLGTECSPGWVGGAVPVSKIAAPEKGGAA